MIHWKGNSTVTVLPPKKICKVCGAEIEGTANFCGNCGCRVDDCDLMSEEIPQKKSKKVQSQPQQNNFYSFNEMKCPNCGSKNFKSCQLIYNSGTRTRSFSASTGYRSHGSNSSLLAQSVAPPSEKEIYWKWFILFFALSFILNPAYSSLPFIISMFILLKNIWRIYWNIYSYPKHYSEWLNSFMCSKCGKIFIKT